jgi:hypothetical protein
MTGWSRSRSAHAEALDLPSPTSAVGLVAVDRDSYGAGVAEHDMEAMLAKSNVLVVMQDPADDEVAMLRRHLQVAARTGIGDGERRRLHHVVSRMPHGVMSRRASRPKD